jgi:hypothetical protein
MKWELSIGNLIQIATVAALLIVWGARQESLNEEARARLADVDARVRMLERSEAQSGVEVASLRRDIGEVKASLNEVLRLLRNGGVQ